MRIASIGICALVAISFLIFAADQSKSASGSQQTALERGASSGATVHEATKHKSGFHKAIDEAASEFTSPFSDIVSASKSEWGNQMVKLILALLVYGFGLGYAARFLRVRV
jgi:hypothetical protein